MINLLSNHNPDFIRHQVMITIRLWALTMHKIYIYYHLRGGRITLRCHFRRVEDSKWFFHITYIGSSCPTLECPFHPTEKWFELKRFFSVEIWNSRIFYAIIRVIKMIWKIKDWTRNLSLCLMQRLLPINIEKCFICKKRLLY